MKVQWKFAVGAVIVALLSVMVFVPRSNSTKEELYAEYFHPYKDVLQLGRTADATFAEGMDAYNRQDYTKAAELLSAYLNSGAMDFAAQFYLGISLIESDRATEGVQYLANVINSKNLLIEHAQWYRALGLLKLNRVEACKVQLKQMDQEGHDYRQQAKELLKKLE